jgi:hypothetical protein
MDSVLEQMFFVTEISPSGVDQSGADQVRARVRFDGEPSGWVDVEVGAHAASMMAADFLAADEPELTPAQIEDVVLELSNMLCGAALSRLETSALMRLSAPQPLGPCDLVTATPAAIRSVNIGTGVITAKVHFGRP